MMKNDKVLCNSRIIREGRLSVVPLSDNEFNLILYLSGEKNKTL
jgi:predicted RNA-binding protein with PUA-like domain